MSQLPDESRRLLLTFALYMKVLTSECTCEVCTLLREDAKSLADNLLKSVKVVGNINEGQK